MRSILATLRKEHDELRELFEKVNATSDRAEKTRRELLQKIEAALIPHAKWEETVFYPAFAERASHDQLLQHAEAIQEHRAVELAVLPDLHASPPDSRQFAGSMKVLSEFIDHHAREEEREMFKSARQLFSAQELAEFDAQYEQWKASAAAAAIAAHAKIKTGLKSIGRNPKAPG
ncbi:hemerythrin domain-containing protein [Luteimonas sp. RD2P54]|uniref:Hemerythrin domain-containing protein n=1 Tax=Luteimonas endophytica TaxID=3042023 RepID=A0ABT6JAW2_9GAMM|nr:hemerythrin domain-containing protein [Luteimonas endophytica]MDH5823959.1 hemerythrin domain-containing protein [Luteimonas endophytica]